jgi:archaellin
LYLCLENENKYIFKKSFYINYALIVNNLRNKRIFSRLGEMGIGTLIIFIALIIVTTIVALVFVQTGSSLQNKALLVGLRTKNQVSTSVEIISISGEDGTNGFIDSFFVSMRLVPGADSIKIDDMLISVYSDGFLIDLKFNPNANCSEIPEFDSGFAVDHLVKSNSYSEGYLQRGEVIKLCFETPAVMLENENFNFILIPRKGNSLNFRFIIPEIMDKQTVVVYP